jgi:branched-chain amino acid transport system permease protein
VRRRRAAWALLGVFAILLPFGLSSSQLATATFILIAAIGATGLNVLTGFTGQISLGHAFFLAVGAYTAAALHDASALVWLPAAGVVAGAGGALIGPVALRLRGLYLAVVTIAIVFIGQHVLLNWSSLSGGPAGRAFPAVVIGPFDFAPGQQLTIGTVTIDHDGLYYYLALAIVALATLFVANVLRSRAGRAMQAVREREAAAALMGVSVARTKVAAFTISASLAGVSGALYASYLSYAQPGQWDLALSIQYLAAIIVGGMGTIAGPLLGCAVVFGAPALLKTLPFVADSGTSGLTAGELSSLLYGVLTIAFLVFEPGGIAGFGRRAAVSRSLRPFRNVGVGPALTTTNEEAHP